MVNMEFCDIKDEVKKITVYNDGDKSEYSEGGEFELILKGWCDMLSGSREMPAFGVSLNDDTLAARDNGVWVEYDFDKVLRHGGMSFERLLVAVKPEFSGFNIVRYNAEGGYAGRCYFIDLAGKNMSQFYDILVNL